MTTRLLMFRFRKTLSGAILALALILGLAGLTGLSSIDMASLFDAPDGALTVAQQ